MSIWDKFKGVFGKEPSSAPVGPPALRAQVEAAVRARAQTNASFIPLDIAGDVSAGSVEDIQLAIQVLDDLFRRGTLEPLGYTRTWKPHPVGNWVYHPVATEAPGAVGLVHTSEARTQAVPRQPASAQVASSPEPVGPGHSAADFQNPEVLGLSDEELRRRAAGRDARRTDWVGPAGAIPKKDQTEQIDRRLVMRGLLTEQQLAEIHQVGDQWTEQAEPARRRAIVARTPDEAVELVRLEKAALKAEKKRLAAEREAQRAAGVARRRAEDIIYLGPGVSGGLGDRRSNPEALAKLALPVLSSPSDIAKALAMSIARLRWLCFYSEAAERTHYVFFEVPKRSGGKRLLSAPHHTLGKAQQWILDSILRKLPVEDSAHGFVPTRSTVTNAAPHLKKDLVVNLDLKDFFPSVTFPRVRGVFRRLGYSPAAATVLALLCTESPRRRVEYAGKPYWVAVGPRGLPQGACTSPALSNQVSRKLDRRLKGMAGKHGWRYTRYADDLTFSASSSNEGQVAMLLARVRHIVVAEGFAIQEKKGRLLRASGRQTVTGIVVNDKPGLPREQVRQLRAILHNAAKSGLGSQNKDRRPNFEAWLRGKIAYLCMIDASKGAAFLKQLDVIEKR